MFSETKHTYSHIKIPLQGTVSASSNHTIIYSLLILCIISLFFSLYAMGNDNDACDTRLTLGLASTDLISKRNQEEEKNVICLDLCIPLHANDHGTKTEGSSSKTCENDEKQDIKSTISLRNFNYKIDNEKNGMRKKLRLTIEQSTLLEESFKRHTTLAMGQKQELAAKLKLKPRQVEVWFQNRRARTKLKQTEVDCQMLKKWCQSLNNENNRLKKELQELRSSFKIDQWPITPFHLQLPKARTIALCPSCQKISRSGTNVGNHIERAAVLIENIYSEQKQCDAMGKGANSDNIFIKESNK